MFEKFHATSRRGQAAVFLALVVVGLVVMAGLAIDGGRVFAERRSAQNGADAAALAAALAKINGQDWQIAAIDRARANNIGENAVVEVYSPPDPSKSCNPSAPPSYDTNHASDYIQVVIRSEVSSTLLSLLNIQTTPTCAEAIARASKAEYVAPFGNAALIALSPHDSWALLFNGAAKVSVDNGRIFSNSDSDQSVILNGGSWFTAQNLAAVGRIYINGAAEMDSDIIGGTGVYATGGINVTGDVISGGDVRALGGSHIQGDVIAGGDYSCLGWCSVGGEVREHVSDVPVPQQINVPDDLPEVPAPPPPPTCSQDGSVEHPEPGLYIVHPGNFDNGVTFNGASTVKFEPGTYCFHSDVNFNGGYRIENLSPGRVQFVLDHNMTLNGGIVMDMDNLEIFTQSGYFIMNGGSHAEFDRFRFYGEGDGHLIVNGGNSLISHNTFLYFKNGMVTWNGGSYLDLEAPPEGDPYTGLLIYMPWENTQTFIFNGGQYIHSTGTFLLPHAKVIFNGCSFAEIEHSQFIAYTFIFNGGSWLHIYYDEDENWRIPQQPVIELVH